MVADRQLSQHPDAVRQRNHRARKVAGIVAAAAAVAPTPAPAVPVTRPSSSSLPLHMTQPASGPGPSAFAAPPLLPPTTEGGEGRPFVAAAPPPPEEKPKTSPEEAKAMAKLVGQYFQAGFGMLLVNNPDVAQLLHGAGALQHFPAVVAFVEGSAERCALKHNLRIPYMDELVVVGALGVATAGFAMKPKPGAAARAKNANPKQQPPSAPSEPESAAVVGEEDIRLD